MGRNMCKPSPDIAPNSGNQRICGIDHSHLSTSPP